MNERNTKDQRLIVIFLAGCLLFNYPILSLFSYDSLVAGIPILYIYIFVVWAALIGLMAIVIEYRGHK